MSPVFVIVLMILVWLAALLGVCAGLDFSEGKYRSGAWTCALLGVLLALIVWMA